MIEGLLSPAHLILILGIALLVLGPKRLPEAGKGIGEAIRGFKSSLNAEDEKPARLTQAAAPEVDLQK